MPKKLLIAAEVDPRLVERLSRDPRFEVTVRPTTSEQELLDAIGSHQVLVTRAANRVTSRVIDAAPALELIAQGTSGIDNLDIEAARRRRVDIVHLPGTNANAVAELVIGYVLALTRTIPQYSRDVKRGIWQRSDCATRHELAYYTLGIVGLGQVGRRVARLATAFGMRVQAYDPYIGDSDFAERHAARIGSLEELLRTSSILTVHVPLTAETRNMIGAPQLELLPRGSYVINAARGEVVDAVAVLAALERGHLAGAAFDVFDPEPPTLQLPDDPRFIVTPHVAGCTYECRTAIGDELFVKIDEWMNGRGHPVTGSQGHRED